MVCFCSSYFIIPKLKLQNKEGDIQEMGYQMMNKNFQDTKA